MRRKGATLRATGRVVNEGVAGVPGGVRADGIGPVRPMGPISSNCRSLTLPRRVLPMSGMKRLFTTSLLLLATAAALHAAAPIPDDHKTGGFAIGCQAYSFNKFTVFEAIEKTAEA